MSVRGRRSIIIGIVGCMALGVIVVARRGHAAPPSPAPLYSYPPNARQLIAAGWEIVRSGRPYLQRYGSGWVQPRLTLRPWSTLPARLLLIRGAPHVALVGRPAGGAASPAG